MLRRLAVEICAVSLPWLTVFAHVGCNLWADVGLAMAAANNASVGAGGVLRFPSPYLAGEYICKYYGLRNDRQFALLPAAMTLTMSISRLERETAYASCRCR